eukprot:6184046-Pleurochrysis_carterae.AAC.1
MTTKRAARHAVGKMIPRFPHQRCHAFDLRLYVASRETVIVDSVRRDRPVLQNRAKALASMNAERIKNALQLQ